MNGNRFALAAIMAFSCAGLAYGGAITYTETATASGSLGGTAFTDALVTLQLVGDTTNVAGSGFFTNSVGTFTVNVAGIGTATFTDALQVFDNQTFSPPAAGFGAVTAGSVLDTFSTSFGSYDLKSAIGPISGAPFINSGESFSTNDGAFILNSSGNSTFTATTAPEPLSATLLAFGLLGMLGYGRLRRRTNV